MAQGKEHWNQYPDAVAQQVLTAQLARCVTWDFAATSPLSQHASHLYSEGNEHGFATLNSMTATKAKGKQHRKPM